MILENHFHAVVHCDNLPRVMADLKKFTAGKLLAQLETERRHWLLDLLAAGTAEHKTRSTWQLWQEGYHPQAIYSDQTMLQSRAERDRLAEGQPAGVPPAGGINIDYIHANPLRRGWVASLEHWRYSSAHDWLPDAQPVLRCDPWR